LPRSCYRWSLPVGVGVDPLRIKQAVKALVPFWLGVLVDGVNKGTCQRYQKQREKAVATVRRELTTLRAAINFAHS
jgi:hypothetical protein